jgi:uncharacterized protein (TIGR03086 family)
MWKRLMMKHIDKRILRLEKGYCMTAVTENKLNVLNAKDFYIRCLEQATSIVSQVEPGDLAKSTPDTEWKVADLLQHILYDLTWTPDIVQGMTKAQVGAAHDNLQINANIPDAWETAAKAAIKAVEEADPSGVAHFFLGDTDVESYLWQAGGDQLIHAWDLAQGIGYVIQFDTELAQAIYDATIPHQDMLAKSGLFAPAVKVDEHADVQTKVLGLYGRSLNWRKS